MKHFNLRLISLFTILIVSACSKAPNIAHLEPAVAYRYLEREYLKGNYQTAVDGLNFYTLNYSGSALVDSAQFLLGLSHFQLKEYLLAANAFNELTRRFPRSPLSPDAMFREGMCYYKLSPRYDLDQENTELAIDAFQNFIEYYPQRTDLVKEAQHLIFVCRNKLAQKEYMSGIIYIKMKDYPSAIIYFQNVLERFYDTDWAPRAMFQIATAHAADGKPADALATFDQFLAKYPDSELRDKALIAMKKISTGKK